MVRELAKQSRVVQPRTKTKTGCATCRIRKIKCDEQKPSCQRCAGTGRICDGYQNLFQVTTVGLLKIAASNGKQAVASNPSAITDRDIELLGHCLTTKTLFNGVNLNCDEEVRDVLIASLTDPSVTHAVLSLKALRKNLSRHENGFPFIPQEDPNYTYGIQQYTLALQDFVPGSRTLDKKRLRSMLLCCQLFISIEQIQSNYSAMARHILGGLRILRDFRSREPNAGHNSTDTVFLHIPPLDIFVIKLFAAPCKFLDPPAPTNKEESRNPLTSRSYSNSFVEFGGSYAAVSDMRRKLKAMAFSTLDLLHKLPSNSKGGESQNGTTSLLQSLELWLQELKVLQGNTSYPSPASLSISFMLLLHAILRVVLLGRLKSSSHTQTMLEIEGGLMQAVADDISDKIRSFNES